MPDLTNFYFTEKYETSVQKTNEPHNVFDNKFVLDFIPDAEKRVTINALGGQTAVEININKEITAINQYKVDYNNQGFVYVHPDLEGQNITINEYYAIGFVKVNAERVSIDGEGDLASDLTNLENRVQNNSDRIDNLIIEAGDSSAEVIDARVAYDSTVYPTLGAHVRKIEENLVNATYGEITDALSNNIDLPNAYDGYAKDIEIKGRTLYNYANNGIDYANWEIQGIGTTKGVNGIHLVSDLSNSEFARLQNVGFINNTVYTAILYISETTLSGRLQMVSPELKTLPYLTTGLFTFTFNSQTSSVFKLNLNSSNFDGEYVDFKLLAILEGDHTSDATITKELDFGFNHVTDATISCANSFKISSLVDNPVLRGLPNGVGDEIGNEFVQNVSDEVVLDGGESWVLSIENPVTIRFAYAETNKAHGKTNIASDEFDTNESVYLDANEEEGICGSPTSNTIFIRINKSKLASSDVTGFKQWLSNNNTTMIYQLATPTTTQLKQQPTLQVAPNTPIQIIADDLTPYLSLKYPQNQSAKIDSITNEITALDSRVDNLEEEIDVTVNGVLEYSETSPSGILESNYTHLVKRIEIEGLTNGSLPTLNPTVKIIESTNESKRIYPTYLASIDADKDKLIDEDGKVIVQRIIDEVALSSHNSHSFVADYVGFKVVSVNNIFPYTPTDGFINKSGVLVPEGDTTSNPDRMSFSLNNLQISISDTDSGWGESYTPTPEDIGDYFSNNSYIVYYKMQDVREDTIIPVGEELSVFEGSNNISIETGIVFEQANPKEGTTTYVINYTGTLTDAVNRLSYQTQVINKVYKLKNNILQEDSNWIVLNTDQDSYGLSRTYINKGLFDVEALYFVEYEARHSLYDSEKFSTTIAFDDSLREVSSTNSQAISSLSNELGVLWVSLLSIADKELAMNTVDILTTETTTDLKNKVNEIINIWK